MDEFRASQVRCTVTPAARPCSIAVQDVSGRGRNLLIVSPPQAAAAEEATAKQQLAEVAEQRLRKRLQGRDFLTAVGCLGVDGEAAAALPSCCTSS